MAINHAFTSPKSDSTDATKVNASNWNAAHVNTDVENETPSGTVDGENATFTLANTPSLAASLKLFRNGVLQLFGTDYILTSATIVYAAGKIPQTGDWHRAYYRL